MLILIKNSCILKSRAYVYVVHRCFSKTVPCEQNTVIIIALTVVPCNLIALNEDVSIAHKPRHFYL